MWVVLISIRFLSPIHLPLVMPSDAPYRLPQGVRPAVHMIPNPSFSVRMMRMKYDHRSLLRILRIMQIPVMPGIVALYRHIILIDGDYVEILRIQILQIFTAEHRQPPSWQTTLPERA